MRPRTSLLSAPRMHLVRKSIACSAIALASAGAATLATPATAQELQFSGPEIVTQVEVHMVAAAGGSGQVYGVANWIGAASLPGLFDSMHETSTEGFQFDANRKQGESRGSLFWKNNDGTMAGSYKVNFSVTKDEKGQFKGSSEGTFEITDGTGRFAHVRGHGTGKGSFDGPNYSGQLNLTVTGFEKRASAQ